jgi:hypothetical protein
MYISDIYKKFKGNNSKYGSLEYATIIASSHSFLAVHVYLPLQPGNVCLQYCVALQYFSHNLQALNGDESDNASNDESAPAPFVLMLLARQT